MSRLEKMTKIDSLVLSFGTSDQNSPQSFLNHNSGTRSPRYRILLSLRKHACKIPQTHLKNHIKRKFPTRIYETNLQSKNLPDQTQRLPLNPNEISQPKQYTAPQKPPDTPHTSTRVTAPWKTPSINPAVATKSIRVSNHPSASGSLLHKMPSRNSKYPYIRDAQRKSRGAADLGTHRARARDFDPPGLNGRRAQQPYKYSPLI